MVVVLRKWAVLLAGPALLAAFGVTAGAATTPSTTTPSGRPPVTRLAGPDRYATAAAVSAATFGAGLDTVYLATGVQFPDALAGAAAAAGHAPVLLVSDTLVPSTTATELGRLAPKHLVVLGGPVAVPDAVVSAAVSAAGGAPATRLAGADRYATAAAVSAATFSPGVPTAYLATGLSFPDALAGSAAAGGHGPVLLAAGDTLTAATASELARLAPKKLIVLGDPTVLSDAAAKAAQSAASVSTFTRLAGLGPAAASAAISAGSFTAGGPVVYLATGLDFADALAGAAIASGHGPILLVTPTTLPDVVAAELRRLHASSTVVLGGTAAVGAAVADASDAATAQGIPASNPQGPAALTAAKAQIGKQYQWGGAGPDVFDCSGLTAWAWNAVQSTLPHNAAAQDDLVADIPVSAAEPGDLLFYGNPDVYHVAVYAGGGMMVEAAHTGVPVRLTPIRTQDLLNAGRPTTP
jgi:cell wall-associated NlpC family hydrolase